MTKRERDKLARAMRKAGVITGALATDLDRARARELKRSQLTAKQLRDAANVHIGNKLLKPDSGFYKPEGITRTMPSLKAGKLQATKYTTSKPKKQRHSNCWIQQNYL